MNWKLLVWSGLATVFLVLAICSWLHYSRYQKAVRSLRAQKMDALMRYGSTDPVRSHYEDTLFLGSESELIGKMIPFEVAGFLAAAIGAIMELF